MHYRLGRERSVRHGLIAVIAACGLTVVGLSMFSKDAPPATGADFTAPVTTAAEPAISPLATPPSTIPATIAPPTSGAASTTTTTTTTTTSTTIAPTTTRWATETLPEQPPGPVVAPGDPHATEPLIQLGGITIPKLGVDAPLLEGIRLSTLDNGPGHWPGTAMPGEVGNVVVAAHRTSHGATFRHIDQLVPGDEVQFTSVAGLTSYRVTGVEVVKPDAIWIIDPTPTPTATLFACHPPGSVRERIVVHLELAT